VAETLHFASEREYLGLVTQVSEVLGRRATLSRAELSAITGRAV
jgi:hypothetical protein